MGDSRVKNENLILDFTHVYCDEYIKDIDRFRYIDCSDIEETDMQIPMVPGMMSCGDWAGLALSQNENLRQLVLVGPPAKDIEQATGSHSGRLLTFSDEELHGGVPEDKLKHIRSDIPLYISIDKDVLGTDYSETNWSQGDMSIGELERLLSVFLGGQDVMDENGEIRHTRILGVDICGESQTDIPVPEYLEAEEKNEKVNTELFQFISEHVRSFR